MHKPAPPRRTFWQLLLRSVMENERFSPRLLTTFSFVLAALLLLWRGAVVRPEVINGILVTGWPPEYIWATLCALIAALLGLGTLAKIKLEGPPPAADTQITAEQATVTGGPVSVNPNPNAPAGQSTE
ncbi:hypothetical protein LJ737_20670 [Hymenobacter sp. 15J16-1T3B]|uniref:hypothetical protein n=1 Tax=Hymenobacter sp. 15J16-1T3B TaxID=2886941 RepID=UPI001D10DB67|nr:hypothetical protein [Hymenobacter sp. 15J16-1T3B]MCC3159667.1 hypothetical protein [Hymenobacter sp. 15J16-1T3B]